MGVALEAALRRMWTRRRFAVLLLPVSALYALLLALHRMWRRVMRRTATSIGVPVLVVGNVVAGGTGKTPVVLALVQHLKARGLRVGVVSRGYGRQDQRCREVFDDSPVGLVGDEALLLRQRGQVPVWVAPHRAEAAQALVHQYPQTQLILSDDGLQHWRLARDLEICLFGDMGLGNRWLLPAGPLRESWPRAVNFVLCSSALTLSEAQQSGAPSYVCGRRLAGYALRRDGSRVALEALRRQSLCALAGIAQPEQFFAMLRAAGLNLDTTHALADHHDFKGGLAPIASNQLLLCTEKDAVKLWPLYPAALAVPLQVDLPLDFLAALDVQLDALLATRLSSPLMRH